MSAAAQALNSPRVLRNKARAAAGTARGTAPVRRDSVSSEDPDHVTRFMPIGERRHLIRVLETYAEERRGKRGVAPITASTLHIARKMLFVLMDRHSGRLDHAYSWIAAKSQRAYQTACAAVAQLEALGVLVVVRRCRRGDDGGAPPWVQDTNLYRFELPAKLRSWWAERQARHEAKARERMPSDFDHHQAEARTRNAAQEAELNAWQFGATPAEKGAALRKVAADLKARRDAARAADRPAPS